jgi:hypothetical protein
LPLFIVGMLIYRGKFIPSYKSTVDRWLGDLSYPLYLVHYPIITAMMDRPIHALAISVVVAIGLKYALEPLELLRSRVRAGQPAPPPSGVFLDDSDIHRIPRNVLHGARQYLIVGQRFRLRVGIAAVRSRVDYFFHWSP